MPRSEERGGMAARSEAEINSILVYKSPARQGGVLYCSPAYTASNGTADGPVRRYLRCRYLSELVTLFQNNLM